MKEKFAFILASVVYLCLFARVFFVICLLKMQGNLRGKNRSDSSLHSLPRVCWRRENREKQQDSRRSTVAFVVRPSIHRRCGVSYFAVYPKLCMFSHPLLVWNIVCVLLLVVFVWVLCSCLIIVSLCAFYGYWGECVVFFMLKNHILVCFLVVGLDRWLVVEVIYVHSLCMVVMHVCEKMVCCCVLGF